MPSKQDVLEEIAALAKHNNITVDDIVRTLANLPTQKAQQSSGILSKLFGYMGGILVFAGIAVFIGMMWDDFSSPVRVIVTLGTGFVLFIMALVALGDERYERVATPLFLASSFLQPAGIFVMLDEYSSGGNPAHGVLFMAIIMMVQHGATLWAKQRTTLAFTTIFFSGVFFSTLFDLWDMDENLIGTVIGTSLMCVSYALSHSRHRPIAAFWYFIGSCVLLVSVFDVVKGTPFELAYLALTSFMIYLSVVAKSRTLLLVGTLAMLCYIGYFTSEHFANTLGWPIVLIIIGLAFMGLGSFSMKIHKKYIKQSP